MININTFIKALHVSWLRRIIIQLDNASWCSVSIIDFGKLFWSGIYKNSVHEHSKSFLERHFKRLAFIL